MTVQTINCCGDDISIIRATTAIQLEVADLESEIAVLCAAGACFRGEIINGRGANQILIEDPAGNPIELFQPAGT